MSGGLDVISRDQGSTCATIELFSDNTPAISHFQKGAVSTDTAASYLCRLVGC